MSFTRLLKYETLRTISIAAGYATLGTPLAHPASIIKLVNISTGTVFISIDGTTDVDIAPASSFWLYDVTSNAPLESDPIFIQKGTQFYAKGAGAGSVYLIVQYVEQV
jgi:hypothetical protein